MAQPTSAITRWDLALNYSQFSLAYNRMGYVGLKIFPIIMVAEQAANFLKVKIESLLGPVEDTKRAPKAEYKSGDFKWDTDSYSTNDHGVEEILDDRQLKMYRNLLRAEIIHRNRAVNRVLQSYESEAITAAQSTSNFNNAAAAVAWTTPATATPIQDFQAAIEAVEARCGRTPDSATIGKKALRRLKLCTQITDRIKYDGFHDSTLTDSVAIRALADLFELKNLNVAGGNGGGFKNTAGEGATPSLSRFWDPAKVLVHCSDDAGGDLEAPLARVGNTICWSEEAAGVNDGEMALIVEEYRQENVRGSRLRARGDWALKLLHTDAGQLITGVVA